MSPMLHLGEIIAMYARLFPDKLGGRDLTRSMTFRQWNDRSCRLANALDRTGPREGDRIAVLAYNCLEWLEIYAASKAGLIVVPVNFGWLVQRSSTSSRTRKPTAIIVQDDLLDRIEAIRAELPIGERRTSISAATRTPPATAPTRI